MNQPEPGRGLRMADQIQRDLAEMIQREVPTERAGLVTLTGVEVSPDYAHAKVYFTTIGAPVEAAQQRAEREGRLLSFAAVQAADDSHDSARWVRARRSVERGIEIDRLIDEANGTAVKAEAPWANRAANGSMAYCCWTSQAA